MKVQSSKQLPRAVFVTQWFPPEPATQASRLAKNVRAAGFDTSVVTGVPNYPSGKVYNGHRATEVVAEVWNGMAVYRSPLYPSHDASALRRIANYASWAMSASLFSLRRFRGAKIACVYSSPATAAVPAMLARRILGVPYVLVIQDVWPDSIFASGFLNGRLAKAVYGLLNAFVNLTYRWSVHIAVISPGMKELLIGRGVSAAKISVVYNSVEVEEMKRETSRHSRSSLGLGEDDLVVMYAGNHGAAQNLSCVVRAIGEMKSDRPAHLVMVGDGMEKEALRRLADEVAPGRVLFLDSVPRSQMADVMSLADVQIVSLASDPLFDVTMPSKVQGILALGRPIWALANGDVAAVVREADAGLVSPPGDLPSARRCLEEWVGLPAQRLVAMADNARAHYESHMTEAVTAQQMTEVLRRYARA